MKLYFLSKTINLLDGRCWHFVHESSDLFYGTENATDLYAGDNADLKEDLRKFGRHAFRVTAIQAFPFREQAETALERYKTQSTYGNAPVERQPHTEATKKKISEALKGEKNPFYGKTHSPETVEMLQKYRKNMRWIHQDELEQQIEANSELPEGWAWGRSPSMKKKMKDIRHYALDLKKKQAEKP